MKVLVVLSGALCFDGISNSVLNYYKYMDRSNMTIGVVSARSTDPDMRANFEKLGCTMYLLENRDKHPLKYLAELTKIVKENHYEIIHAHGNSATLALEMIAGKLGGARVRIVHSRNSFCGHKRIDKFLRPIMYASYTDGFACGQKAGEWLFETRPFTIINNGKDIDRFLFDNAVRKEYREKLGVGENTVVLGHVGLFHPQKNHTFLIEVFEKVCKTSNSYKLVLIGDGEKRDEIERLVEEKGLSDKVIFLGRQTSVNHWLQAMDLMVFPSLFEGMPNVVLEWQLAGLPCLISDVITRECQITGTVDYLPLSGGPELWADRILSMKLGNRDGHQEEIRNQFQAAGFDIAENARRLRKMYEALIEARS